MKKRLFAIFMLLTTLLVSCSSADGDAQQTEANETEVEAVETTTAEVTEKTEAETTEAPPVHEPAYRINHKDPDFFILYTDGEVDYTDAPKAYVDIYKWGDEYTPTTYAQMVFKEGDGFYVRMECEETEPRAVNTEYNQPIYEDSCMEFFAIYKPELSDKYINIEMNANAAYLCYFCDSIKATEPIDKYTDNMPELTSFVTETTWGLELHVPVEMIEDTYGEGIGLGDCILMNLYKCGDKTHTKHYGSWAEIDNPSPNFHLPQFFCKAEIREP